MTYWRTFEVQGNLNNHKPAGHKSRGIHKRVTAVAMEPPRKFGTWKKRKCPKCGRPIFIQKWVKQTGFHDHVRSCEGV